MKHLFFLLSLLLSLFIFAGCNTLDTVTSATVFAKPKVLYATATNIGVEYRSAGIQSLNEADKAMEMIASHCGGDYTVNIRSEENGWTTVDASCN